MNNGLPTDAMKQEADSNLITLGQNTYPGRGLVVGLDEWGTLLVMIYWLMGRSPDSRNRVLVSNLYDFDTLRTAYADPTKRSPDEENLIYEAMAEQGGLYVVSNGHQTDHVLEVMQHDDSFHQAVKLMEPEFDPGNRTARITAIGYNLHSRPEVEIAVVRKPLVDDGESCERQVTHYERLPYGLGYCVHTYSGDGKPLPRFEGAPFLVPLRFNSMHQLVAQYWNTLNRQNRVAMAIKFVDLRDGSSQGLIINRFGSFRVATDDSFTALGQRLNADPHVAVLSGDPVNDFYRVRLSGISPEDFLAEYAGTSLEPIEEND